MPPEAGSFYRLRATEALPPELRRSLPEALWLPSGASRANPAMDGRPALCGRAVDGSSAEIVLAFLGADGARRLAFDPDLVAEGILLEKYHAGLERTAEMRLPFNYSKLPIWLKSAARKFRMTSPAKGAQIPFPPAGPPFVVDWLVGLSAWAGGKPLLQPAKPSWPDGKRAAVAVTHDVDTDWALRNREWLERFCDMEEACGLRGGWYCVPAWCESPEASRGIERLLARGCEIGCHGYNHDAQWPFLDKHRFDARLAAARDFSRRWGAKGFRSEWLWRTPDFLTAIATVFDYDTSVPSSSPRFTRGTRNGCGTAFPFRTHGGMLELPLTLPMDDDRHFEGIAPGAFWERQVERSEAIIAAGGLVLVSLHPQPHQSANEENFPIIEDALRRMTRNPGLWRATPGEIARWVLTGSEVKT